MHISRNSWYVKLYKLMYDIFSNWIGRREWYNSYQPFRNGKLDVCTFVRYIFILGPLALASNLITFFFLYLILFYVPVSLAGYSGPFLFIGSILAIAAAVAAFLFVIGGSIYLYEKGAEFVNSERSKQHTGFMKIMGEYYRGIKDKTCVIMEIDNDK